MMPQRFVGVRGLSPSDQRQAEMSSKRLARIPTKS